MKLQINDVVITKCGEKHVIKRIVHEEAEGNTPFYRWDVNYPFDIEHAAMGDEHSIIAVQ